MKPAPSPTDSPRSAPAPLDKHAADLVLCSRYNVDFRVRSQILLEASSVRHTMLPSLQSNKGHKNAPVLEVDEESDTLETLLRICYPIRNPSLDDMSLRDLEAGLLAAVKYDMELPVSMFVSELLRRAEDAPIAIWALACKTGQEDLACKMAERTLALESLACDPAADLAGVTAGQYYRLREFWRLRGKVDKKFRFCEGPHSNELVGPVQPPISLPATQWDLGIRSSDGVVYNVHESVICMISSKLQSKIRALRPRNESDPLPGQKKKSESNKKSSKNGYVRGISEMKLMPFADLSAEPTPP